MMLIRLLPFVLLVCSFVSHAEIENCELLEEKIKEIDKLKNKSDFEQVISFSKKVEFNYAHCQKGSPVEFHRLFYITLSTSKRLNLDEKVYNETLDKIKANLQFIEGDYSLREYEVHLQEVDFLILKIKRTPTLTAKNKT